MSLGQSHHVTYWVSAVPSRSKLNRAVVQVIERLEARRLLAADLTMPQIDSIWTHLKPAAQHDIAVMEYVDPQFQVQLDSGLATYGLAPIPPEAGTLSFSSGASRAKVHIRHHKPPTHRKPHHRRHGKDGPLPPTVSDATYYYDQPLPNQVAFTFDEDVTSSNWNNAVTVLDLNTGATIPVSGTYSSALDTIVYNLNNNAELSDGNYAAILHGSQIVDTTNSLSVVGSDGIAGHDYATNFFFYAGDFNHDRSVNFTDLLIVGQNYNTTGKTYSQGDSNYDGSVNFTDLGLVGQKYGASLPLLGTPGTPTAYIASSSSLDIFWNPPSGTLVTQYDLYRNSTLIASAIPDDGTSGTLAGAGYLDTGLSLDTTYGYLVVGMDASGDSSCQSTEIYAAIAPATPTYSLSGDATVTEGDTYYLGGAFANANNDEPSQWNISWGDGASATYSGFADAVLDSNDQIGGPADAFHTYSQPGAYTITGSVLSDLGTYTANSVVVDVTDATPSFSVIGNQTFVQGQPYAVSATFTDVDAQQGWSISWGDGSTADSGSGSIPANPTHVYSSGSSAPFTINAVITTDDGAYTNSSVVDEAMPTVSVTGSASVQQGATYVLTDSFSDPAGQSASGWSIDWGDGSTSTYAGSASQFTHTYTQTLSDGGAYTIAASVADPDGTYYAAPADVIVNLTTLLPSLALTGAVTVGTAATITNHTTVGGSDAIEGWTIAWGDGTDSYFANNPTSFKHTYTVPGTYTLGATANTIDQTYATSAVVSISDHPTLSLSVFYGYPTQNLLGNLGVNFSDPGNAAPITGYVVDWGDGSASTFGASPDYSGTFSHIYHTYGTVTVRATVDTDAATYTTAISEYILPNLPYFGFLGNNGYALNEAGTPFTLHIPYNGTGAIPQYTIDWGDGSAPTTSSAPSLTHVYSFDTSHTVGPVDVPGCDMIGLCDDRHYTLTVAEDGQTLSGTGQVLVFPSSEGVVSVGPTAAVTEGINATFSATWSDTLSTYSTPDASQILWGDGTSTPVENLDAPLQGSTHNYALAGTYTIEWDAVYTDRNSPVPVGTGGGWYDQQFDVAAYQTVIVGRATPTVGVTGGASIAEQQNYLLYSTFSNPTLSQETRQLWTISWGDGHTSVYQGYSASQFAHAYAAAGNETIGVTLVTNEGTYTATWNVSVTAPTLSISGSTAGVAYEDPTEGSTYNSIIVTRSVSSPLPLNVSFTIGGTANANEYELTDAAGDILTNTVTIPANATLCTVYVSAIEDQTPSWTDTLALTLGPSTAYAVDPVYNTASSKIVDDKLSIAIGDGSSNIHLQGSEGGDQHIATLHLSVPSNIPAGASVTLTELNPASDPGGPVPVVVWTQVGAAPDILDRNQTSYTWTSGQQVPTTLYLGAESGSINVNDIQFSLAITDPSAPAGAQTRTAVSNKATAVYVWIKDHSANASLYPNQDIDSTVRYSALSTLVGQLQDLEAVIVDPWHSGSVKQWGWGFSWNVPGNIAYNWTPLAYTPALTRVLGGQQDPNGVWVGTAEQRIEFFWIATADGRTADTDQITVTYSPYGWIGNPVSVSAKFSVGEPTVWSAVTIGAAGLAGPLTSPDLALLPANGLIAGEGVEWDAAVSLPPGSQGGSTWAFAQTLKSSWTFYDTRSHTIKNPTLWGLDTQWPYHLTPFPVGPDPVTGLPIEEWSSDAPGTYSVPPDRLTESQSTQFRTYLMFLPADAAPGERSRWVPLGVANWQYTLAARKNSAGLWILTPNAQSQAADATFSPVIAEPQWDWYINPIIAFT